MASNTTPKKTMDDALNVSFMDENGLSERRIKEAFRASEKAFNQFFDEFTRDYGVPLQNEVRVLKEKTEVLDGSRSKGAKSMAAVRFNDLRALKQFPSEPENYRFLTAAPTADDYNKLYADVRKLYELLSLLAATVGKQL